MVLSTEFQKLWEKHTVIYAIMGYFENAKAISCPQLSTGLPQWAILLGFI